jgi:hypothetical protein
MPQKPSRHIPLDAATLDLLACPACKAALSLQDRRLVCDSCKRSYPIVDGIPVLITERAELPGSTKN